MDFYELKARLLEAGGDITQSAEVVDAGRDLDRQDWYINNQATKTLLRAGRMEDARKRIAMFTRHEGNPEQNLYDMQCTWYELEVAGSWGGASGSTVSVCLFFDGDCFPAWTVVPVLVVMWPVVP